jgi:SAM-dependent methyltransferase
MPDERPPTLHERLTGHPWDVSYQGRSVPWDLGRPHTPVVELANRGAFSSTVLETGCGTGEDALELASRGLDVYGIDVSPTAVEMARHKSIERRIASAHFVDADALHLADLGRKFSTALDCGLFHTFDDDERRQYVHSLAAVVTETLYLLCFSDATPGDGGPRRISQTEILDCFHDGWRVEHIEPVPYETRFGEAAGWLATISRESITQ